MRGTRLGALDELRHFLFGVLFRAFVLIFLGPGLGNMTQGCVQQYGIANESDQRHAQKQAEGHPRDASTHFRPHYPIISEYGAQRPISSFEGNSTARPFPVLLDLWFFRFFC
jgi:hypothetical protein